MQKPFLTSTPYGDHQETLSVMSEGPLRMFRNFLHHSLFHNSEQMGIPKGRISKGAKKITSQPKKDIMMTFLQNSSYQVIKLIIGYRSKTETKK